MSLDPWAPPKAELESLASRRVGLTRAVLEGVASSLVVEIGLGFVLGLSLFFLEPDLRHLSPRQAMGAVPKLPYMDVLAASLRLAGVLLGGAVAARRYRGRWLVSPVCVALFFLGLRALALPRGAPSQVEWIALSLLFPVALLGGVLGRRRH